LQTAPSSGQRRCPRRKLGYLLLVQTVFRSAPMKSFFDNYLSSLHLTTVYRLLVPFILLRRFGPHPLLHCQKSCVTTYTLKRVHSLRFISLLNSSVF